MAHRQTQILAGVLIAAIALLAFSSARLSRTRASAIAAADDLAEIRADISDISIAGKGTGGAGAPSASSDSGFHNRIRDAAKSAGIAEKLASIEPGQPSRLPGTDYTETPAFLRLENVSLKQVVGFLHFLAEHDANSRTREIVFQTGGDDSAELWGVDVTMGYLGYVPRAGAGAGAAAPEDSR